MSKPNCYRCISLIIIFILVGSAAADNENRFRDNKREGFYWYQDPEPEDEEELNPENPQSIQAHEIQPNLTPDQIWNMHPDAFQALLNVRMKLAVQNPSESNVSSYLQMQDIARRKSLAFASAVKYVGMQNPMYAANESSYPITTPGQRALNAEKDQMIDSVIEHARDDFALIMFERADCNFCIEQGEILEFFEDAYQWPVRKIDITQMPSLVSRFNIQITPTVMVVHRQSENYMPVGYGVVSFSELKGNIYQSIRVLRGDVSPQEMMMHDYQNKTHSKPGA